MHDERVRRISEQVRARPEGQRLTIRKNHPGHTPHDLSYKDGCHPVVVDDLDHIVALDGDALTDTVEGQVTLGRLCKESLSRGMLPKVVPEFETFTIAGLVNGLGIETSSHRHGVFPAALLALEVVLGNGEVVEATREQHFRFDLEPPARLVRDAGGGHARDAADAASRAVRALTLLPFQSATRLCECILGGIIGERICRGIHSRPQNCHVLGTGQLLASRFFARYLRSHSSRETLWYYQHAEKLARTDGEDLVPSYQYMFRHERSLLWLSGIVADLSVFSHTRWGRHLLDVQAKKQVRTNGFRGNLPFEIIERCLVNQDMGMRLSRLEEGLDWVDQHLGVHPLWNCPAGRGALELPFAASRRVPNHDETIVDIGIYGEPTVRGFRSFETLRALQRSVDVPSLWGVSYLSPEELHAVFDFDAHEAMRAKYHAEAFSPIESKIHFMKPSGKGPIPLWRLLNLYYDVKARFGA